MNKRIICVLLAMLVFSLSAMAQTKSKTKAKTREKAFSESVDLSSPANSGPPKPSQVVTYSGSVVKRQFDRYEITFSGFVLRGSKDNRTFINIDTDYAAGVGDGMLGDLAYQLKIGRRIKITTYLCSHILYLKRVQLLP